MAPGILPRFTSGKSRTSRTTIASPRFRIVWISAGVYSLICDFAAARTCSAVLMVIWRSGSKHGQRAGVGVELRLGTEGKGPLLVHVTEGCAGHARNASALRRIGQHARQRPHVVAEFFR